MKIVDEKGKLFGIINIFDLLVLCILVSCVFFAFQWFRIGEDPSWVRVKIIRTRCIGSTINPDYVTEIIKEGDTMLDGEGLVLARIEKVLDNQPREQFVYYSKDGEKLILHRHDKKDRALKLVVSILSYRRQDKLYSCITNSPIKVGESFPMDNKNYSIMINIRKIVSGEEIQDAT